MDPRIRIHDLHFTPFISAGQLQQRIDEMGAALTAEYKGRNPLFLGVLNGAFVFAADLLRACDMDCEMSFIRLASYAGTVSSGAVATVIGLREDVRGRDIIIVEDIVDSGRTLHQFLPDLWKLEPASVKIAALLVKPDAMEFEVKTDFIGFEIPPKFVVGYGLDYNGLGRNLKDIWQLEVGET